METLGLVLLKELIFIHSNFKPLITEEVLDELRAFNELEEMKQRKEEIKEEVYHMSMRQLRRELLKYKYYELEKITYDTDSIYEKQKLDR